jgi:type I restriction enzyme R subunit
MGQVFDRDAEVNVSEHSRPHWFQPDTITFVTMRLADSIPREVIERWNRQRIEFLARCGIECGNWRLGRQQLTPQDRAAFEKQFQRAREDELDTCRGRCQLRDPPVARIVADSLLCFDGDRYELGDFVVMPNHVHLLASFPSHADLRKQCYSWMRFTARQINHRSGSSGSLWQEEPFDHLVRSEKQLQYLRHYIQVNPTKAAIPVGQSLYRKSKRLF